MEVQFFSETSFPAWLDREWDAALSGSQLALTSDWSAPVNL